MTPSSQHTVELSLEGLVGPTHNYAGLSPGNLASQTNKNLTSKPKDAALQALNKAKFLSELGIAIAICPPQPRPRIDILKQIGFTGTNKQILTKAFDKSPHILAAIYSASAMWTANAATITPATDTPDHKTHITPANLTSNFHRSLETEHTANILKHLFPSTEHFTHHPPLPTSTTFSDEGAANHTRLSADYSQPGLHIFTYNQYPKGRQNIQASAAIARQHQISKQQTLFIEQNPLAVDAGVFHNDVIATGNRDLFLYHELAYTAPNIQELIQASFQGISNHPLHIIKISDQQLPLSDAIESYFFNSQIVSPSSTDQILITPLEAEHNPYAHQLIEDLLQQNILTAVHYLNVRQSMQNGGGPACLRLRIQLTNEQIAHMHTPALLTPKLYQTLANIITDHYRDQITPDDLADPALMTESQQALGHIYKALCLTIS